MIGNLTIALVIPLFLLQNCVFCWGHMHLSDNDSDPPRTHLHWHDHAHGDHGHHHHELPTPDGDQRQNQDPHDCVISTLKQEAIQDSDRSIIGLECTDSVTDFGDLARASLKLDPARIPVRKSNYWHQSTAIHLQVCALLI